MAQFICEKQGRCCPHEFYNSIEQAIADSEDGVPCDHLIEVAPVRHGRWTDGDPYCPICRKNKFVGLDADIWADWQPDYCPNCGAKMDGGDGNSDIA